MFEKKSFKSKKHNRALSLFVMVSMVMGMLVNINVNVVQAATSQLLSTGKPVLASSNEGVSIASNALDGNTSTRWANAVNLMPHKFTNTVYD
jgi:hypothetical protein